MGHNASKLEEDLIELQDGRIMFIRMMKGASTEKKAHILKHIHIIEEEIAKIKKKIGTPPSSPKQNAVTA